MKERRKVELTLEVYVDVIVPAGPEDWYEVAEVHVKGWGRVDRRDYMEMSTAVDESIQGKL